MRTCPANYYAEPVDRTCSASCGTLYAHDLTHECVEFCPDSFADPNNHKCVDACHSLAYPNADNSTNYCVLRCPD